MAKVGKRKSKEYSFLIDDCRCTGRITDSILQSSKTNKNNKGIILTFKCRDGKQKGKEIKQWFNVVHTNQQTEEIALEQLDHIAFCCGLDSYKDTKEFHGIDLEIDVSNDGKYNSVEVFPFEGKKKSGKKGKKGKKKKDW